MAKGAAKGKKQQPARKKAPSAATSGIDALCEQAMAHHRQGQLTTAGTLYRQILSRDPSHLDALQLLGVIEFQAGRFEAATGLLQRAVSMAPEEAGLHCNLGLALHELGRLEEALACQERALLLRADFAEALNNRANVLREMKRLEEAERDYRKAVNIRPEFSEALYNLGRLLLDQQRPEDALVYLTRCLRLAYHQGAQWQCGVALLALKRPQEALAALDGALRSKPDDAEVLYWRGNALLELAKPQEAVASYRRALQLRPDLADAHYNLATVLLDLEQHEEALAAFGRALSIRPDYVEALYNLGGALGEIGRHLEAAAAFERLVALAPEHRFTLGKLFHCRQSCCDWSRHPEHVEALVNAMHQGKALDMPLSFLAVTSDPGLQLRCSRAYTASKYPVSATPLGKGEGYRHDRIRIAYVSADLREQPVSFLLAGVFEAHDRERFETTAISLRPPDGSAMGRRVATAFERFVDASRMTDAETAALMRELEVDIAIDLTGYTQDNRTAIFAARPAPVQVNYLGFPGSMGADYMDYIVADAFVIPPAATPHYAEHVVHMPHCFQGNDDQREIAADRPSRAAASLPETGFVFCAFNSVYKFNPPLFDVWMRLLRAVPDSVLWLAADAPALRLNLAAEAARRGVESRQLVFSTRVPYSEHLARLGLADLFLDTLPFNAGTTASDALWAGLPVLTCAGEAFAARMAGSLLRAIGLPELITHDLVEYEALALRLATTPALLASIRIRLAENRTRSPLFDTRRFTRHLEAAYLTMAERQRRGEPAAGFAVPAMASAADENGLIEHAETTADT